MCNRTGLLLEFEQLFKRACRHRRCMLNTPFACNSQQGHVSRML
jgi:hypothetical protein